MASSLPFAPMKNTIANLYPDISLLQQSEVKPGTFAVLLGKDWGFAVCLVDSRLKHISAPNYKASGPAVLSGPLSRSGFDELLQWTSRETAIERYRWMTDPPSNLSYLVPAKSAVR